MQRSDYSELLSRIESQNPAVHANLREMRLRSGISLGRKQASWDETFSYRDECPSRNAFPSLTFALFLAALIAFGVVIGRSLVGFVTHNWTTVLLCIGAACVGALLLIVVSRIGCQPFRGLQPPAAHTDQPLKELEGLANRTAARLRTAYRVQVCLVLAVFIGLAGIVAWSMLMFRQKRVAHASVFGSGGVVMVALSRWKWQPFERMAEARRLADQADVLATALRVRMKTIEEIPDPVARAKAQWEAAAEYLRLS